MGMRMSNIKMTSRVDKGKLLETLRGNLSRHSAIVREAREGYIKKAMEALERRLVDLRAGKTASLTFNMTPPADYSEVYRSCIKMLEWTTDESVELQADEFKQLVLDEWDWTHGFYATNSAYSGGAQVCMDGLSADRGG